MSSWADSVFLLIIACFSLWIHFLTSSLNRKIDEINRLNALLTQLNPEMDEGLSDVSIP